MYKKIMIVVVFIFFTIFIACIASADQTGDPGIIKSLHRNAVTSDLYSSYHAQLIVLTEFGDDVYKWGGNHCPGFDIIPIMEEALNDYAKDKNIQIEPFF